MSRDPTLAPWVGRLFAGTRDADLTSYRAERLLTAAEDIRTDLDRFLVYVGDSLEWASTVEIGLRSLISERDKWVGERDRSIMERDRSILERERQIADRDQKLAQADADIRRELSRNRYLQKTLKEAREENDKIYESTSWKVTTPFRWFTTIIKGGPRKLGNRWYLNPLFWLFSPIWLAIWLFKLRGRLGLHLRWKVHQMTLDPSSGIIYHPDRSFSVEDSVARFNLRSISSSSRCIQASFGSKPMWDPKTG